MWPIYPELPSLQITQGQPCLRLGLQKAKVKLPRWYNHSIL